MATKQANILKRIKISGEPLKIMKEDAIASFPNECCGFFYGREGKDLEVEEAHPVKNSKDGDQSRRFEISPLDYMKAEKYALENDLRLLGVYHSHPNHPAIPSEHDLKQAMPNFSYIIVSILNEQYDDIKSWRLNDANVFIEESII